FVLVHKDDRVRIAAIRSGGLTGRRAPVTVRLPQTLKRHVSTTADPGMWPVDLGFSDDDREFWGAVQQFSTVPPDGVVHRWDAATGRELPALARHPGGVVGVHYPPDGKSVITVGAAGAGRRWGRTTGRELDASDGPDGRCRTAFSADGTTFARAGGDRIDVYDTRTGARRTLRPG